MADYDISDKAASDMARIYDDMLSRDKREDASTRFFADLLNVFQDLADFPEMGRTRSYLVGNTRAFNFKNYMVFYIKQKHTVLITGVLHGAQDLIAYFDDSK